MTVKEAEKIDVEFLPFCANLNCTKDADIVFMAGEFMGNLKIPLCNSCALTAFSIADNELSRFARIANKKRLLDAIDNYEPHKEETADDKISQIMFGG